MDIREIDGLWCDDISFCPEQCERMDCPRNSHHIRDKSVPHSYFMELPPDCPKKEERIKTMYINKHGVIPKEELKTEAFKCENCGCEFTAAYDEYYVEKGSHITSGSSTTFVYKAMVDDIYICSCPDCYKIVTKTKQRYDEIPCTLSGMSSTTTIDVKVKGE